MNDKPIPESYWVVPGCFLAGGYPISSLDDTIARQCLSAFLEAGFDTFFDLTRMDELPPYLPSLQEEAARHGISIQYQRMNIQDRGLPSHVQMVALLDAIQTALAAGRKVYLHCWGGIGRTGVTVGCWLVHQGLTGDQALIQLNEFYRTAEQSHHYPQSPETNAQGRFILEWKDDGLA
jgi:Cyclin-dependent kinase inhibitor 3 (CDKN3)